MPQDKTIAALTTASTLTGAEVFPLVQSGETRQAATSLLASYVVSAALDTKVNRAGDTMTGALEMQNASEFVFKRGDTRRWKITGFDDAGDSLRISAFDNDGNELDPVIRGIRTTNAVELLRPLGLAIYTVASLPVASSYTGGLIYVSDGTSNKRLAVSDGTDWRFPDGAVVS
jgi:hypothetical protein